MSIEVKYTPDFERQLKRLYKKYPLIYNDLSALIDELETAPDTGKPLGKNLYKISPFSCLRTQNTYVHRALSYLNLK